MGKSFIQQAKEGLDKGIEHLCFDRYKVAMQRFREVIEVCKPLYERGRFSGSRPYSCYIISSAFGLGLAEGLVEYHSSPKISPTYIMNASRTLSESVDLFLDPNNVAVNDNMHINIGRCYGLLGLKKSGLDILDRSRDTHIYDCYGIE